MNSQDKGTENDGGAISKRKAFLRQGHRSGDLNSVKQVVGTSDPSFLRKRFSFRLVVEQYS